LLVFEFLELVEEVFDFACYFWEAVLAEPGLALDWFSV